MHEQCLVRVRFVRKQRDSSPLRRHDGRGGGGRGGGGGRARGRGR